MDMKKLKAAHWRVTEYGLETIIPDTLTEYAISADRLLPINNPGYDWQVHLAQKCWVDTEQFYKVYDEALETHRGRYRETIDRSQILKNREIARAKAAARTYKPGDYVEL
jgi:hypothetical protein